MITAFDRLWITAITAILVLIVPMLSFFFTIILLDNITFIHLEKVKGPLRKAALIAIILVAVAVAVALGVFNQKVIVTKIVETVAMNKAIPLIII